MAFFQEPPSLPDPFRADRVLQSYLDRVLPADVKAAVIPELEEMGELAGGPLHALAMADRDSLPVHTPFDAWGKRVDHIELTATWKEAAKVAAERGVVATAYERKHGPYSRIHQFALAYLFNPSTHVYSCPLAMTDGAAKTLVSHKNSALLERALGRLTSRDPKKAWWSGQWMTERTGGSDVAISETVARKDGDAYRLYGTKWFTSAATSDMTLTLARPEGNPPGGSGLALFYLELKNPDGSLNGIVVNRLKDKLGTRMVPTAELTLDGARALPVSGLGDGVKNITPMLNITRTWNAVCSVSGMQRGLLMAKDYAKKRVAFGNKLSEKPLHVDTLAGLQAEANAAFFLCFRAVELLGREEAGVLTEEESKLLRAITPLAKLVTAKQAVGVASEVLEAFGGAGYVEDTGLPVLLRDAQVLPIWEGTTNVLSLDLLRALGKSGSMEPLEREVSQRARAADAEGKACGLAAEAAIAHAKAWLMGAIEKGPPAIEAGARRFALTVGRAVELALLVEHAAWARARGDGRPLAAARRFARNGVDRIVDEDLSEDARVLAGE